MSRDPAFLIEKHRSTGLLLDSNLLLLLIVGTFDRRLVGTFKRLNVFAVEDFDLLVAVTDRFRQLYVTPHILTEVSNLAGGLTSPVREECFRVLAASIAAANEVTVPAARVAATSPFVRFGITDATIIEVAATPHLVMTIDFPLAQYLDALDLPVLNFNHIRHLGWS